jgi:hypothetical protein
MSIKYFYFVLGLLIFCTSCKKSGSGPVDPPGVDCPPAGTHPLAANSYCVSPCGNDANPGTLDAPWKSINNSAAKIKPGDTLFVRGGTYIETVFVAVSGSSSAPVNIYAYPNELPVIDGNKTLPTGDWNGLVNLVGEYIHFSGFEVKNTILGNHARGISLWGKHNTVSNCNVHHTQTNGILIQGDYGIVEDSKVWQTDQDNAANPGSGWASALSAARGGANDDGITDYAIIRRNVVHDNWGEGLSAYEAKGTIIEDNIIYDNYAQNFYISDAVDVLFQRNIIYNTPNNTVGQQQTSALADERSSVPRSNNNRVINNMFLNVDFAAFSWTIVPGSQLNNALIANNTFVNSKLNTRYSGTGNRIMNNIFTTSGTINSTSGITWSNNLWQSDVPTYASSDNDVQGDPLLSKAGSTGPGQLSAEYFKILSASPAINKARSLTEVTVDFFKKVRGESPDIGAHEF